MAAPRAPPPLAPKSLDELGEILAELEDRVDAAVMELDSRTAWVLRNVGTLVSDLSRDRDLYRVRESLPALTELLAAIRSLSFIRDQLLYFRQTVGALNYLAERYGQVACDLAAASPSPEPCPQESIMRYASRMVEMATAAPQPVPTLATRAAAARLAYSLARALVQYDATVATIFEAEREASMISLSAIPFDERERATDMVNAFAGTWSSLVAYVAMLKGVLGSMRAPALKVAVIYGVPEHTIKALLEM